MRKTQPSIVHGTDTQSLPAKRANELKSEFTNKPIRLSNSYSFTQENFEDINLVGAQMSGSDFSGAIFAPGQNMQGAIFEQCRFGPPLPGMLRAQLKGVNLSKAKLQKAILRKVVLRDCFVTDANLSDVDLSESDCSGTDFSYSNMHNVNFIHTNLYRSRFFKTRMTLRRQPILQTNKEDYFNWCKEHSIDLLNDVDRIEQAVAIYLELKENFRSIGTYSESSWAYTQERRMRRIQHLPVFAKECYKLDPKSTKIRKILFYLKHLSLYLGDTAIDLTTGYGESLAKAATSLLVLIILIFPFFYLVTGGVNSNINAVVNNYKDYRHLLLFSAGNLLQGYPGYSAASDIGTQIQIIQQLISILMIGLIGFILGNRINKS